MYGFREGGREWVGEGGKEGGGRGRKGTRYLFINEKLQGAQFIIIEPRTRVSN